MRIHPSTSQDCRTFRLVQSTVEKRNVLGLPGHDVEQTKTIQVLVLELLQFFTKNDGVRFSIDIKQREGATRLISEDFLNLTQDRCNPRTCRECQKIPLGVGLNFQRKRSIRHH